MNTSASGLHTN